MSEFKRNKYEEIVAVEVDLTPSVKKSKERKDWRDERARRIEASKSHWVRGKTWEEYSSEMEAKALEERAELESKIKNSENFGTSDEEAALKKNPFSMSRVKTLRDEEGRVVRTKEKIEPRIVKLDGLIRYRNDHTRIRPRAHKEEVTSSTAFSEHVLAENIMEFENRTLNAFKSEDQVISYKEKYEKSIRIITSKYMTSIEAETAFQKSRIEYIDSLLLEKFPKKEVTKSEPTGMIVSMRGWMRAGVQRVIKILELI